MKLKSFIIIFTFLLCGQTHATENFSDIIANEITAFSLYNPDAEDGPLVDWLITRWRFRVTGIVEFGISDFGKIKVAPDIEFLWTRNEYH